MNHAAGSFRAQLLSSRNQLRAALSIPIPPTSRVVNGTIGTGGAPRTAAPAPRASSTGTGTSGTLSTGATTRLAGTALAAGGAGTGYGLLGAIFGGSPAAATEAQGAAAVAASSPRGSSG